MKTLAVPPTGMQACSALRVHEAGTSAERIPGHAARSGCFACRALHACARIRCGHHPMALNARELERLRCAIPIGRDHIAPARGAASWSGT